ncbi:hypothetical protein RB195_015161 [Necator americanus]|uniref:Uncharacterized protein n=1 Tax=Necator americanus TaxID=51031 RepID=A0ABR1E521_NECAM
MSRKKFAFASVEAKSTYSSIYALLVALQLRKASEKVKMLQQDRHNEYNLRAKEFEKACEDKNPNKTYALLKQHGGKIKRYSLVLNTANGMAIGDSYQFGGITSRPC